MTFTAAQLEAALEAQFEDDSEIYVEGWYEMGSASVKNPEYDGALYNEYDMLRRKGWGLSFNDRAAYDAAHALADAFYQLHKPKLQTYLDTPHTVTIDGMTYPVEHVVQSGGEGQGDELYTVVKVDGRLFRKDGYYASYDGGNWDGEFREVNPVTRSVVFYE